MIYIWIILGLLITVTIYDLTQKRHAILRNFPIVGHFRYWLESIGPELRQYIVTDNNEERPFSRNQRRWVYASSKKENDYFGFGTDKDLEISPNYLIIKNDTVPFQDPRSEERAANSYAIPCAKVMGEARGRRKAFRPESIVNISAMSFGSLSGPAVEALNRGAKIAGCYQNTGEGGVSCHHKKGGNLIWQIGTGYFGCRDARGNFSLSKLKDVVASNPIMALEIKLSQGAKPGIGGYLPGIKVNHEIADARGVPIGTPCVSPPAHSAFDGPDSLLDFVEMLASETGLPVGIKASVGKIGYFIELASLMKKKDRGIDFITIDGGEGGTGAAPLVFSDHVAFPFKIAFSRVYAEFAKSELQDRIVFIGSGKLGLPESTILAFAMGCDLVNIAREAMMSIGCIQAQRCHTNHCPTGVATQNKWLARGLDPTLKSIRAANYITTLRKEVLRLTHAVGAGHPAFISGEDVEILDPHYKSHTINELFNYQPGWGFPSRQDRKRVLEIMMGTPTPA